MFYATIDNGEAKAFRFYTKADRALFVADHVGGRAVSAKEAKFVPGSDRCITFTGKSASGNWFRV